MRIPRESFPRLYAITNSEAGGLPTCELINELVRGGAQLIQIREKSTDDASIHDVVLNAVAEVPATVRLIVNDRPDIALAASADGVHLGARDIPPSAVRRIPGGERLILGVSAHSLEEVEQADSDDAVDYIALGPIFRSRTKTVREPLGLEILRQARAMTEKPLVAIGGIDSKTVRDVLAAGADSIAVIEALYSRGTIVENVHRLLESLGQTA